MALTRRAAIAVVLCGAAALLAWLRDPAWVLSYSHGLRPPEVQADGRRARWTEGHAAFHVPADLRSVTLPLRSLKEHPADWPITALITVDDRPIERVTFQDESWRLITVRLPPRGNRRARRVDIKLDRVRSRNLGIQIGEVEFNR